VLCFILAAFTSSPVYAAGKVFKWKCQSHWPTASPSYQDSLLSLIDKLKKRSDGRLIIEPFPAGALVPSKEAYNAVKRGMVQMATNSPAYLRSKLTTAGIAYGLPFAFQNNWESIYFTKHLGFEKIIRKEAAKDGVFYASEKSYPTELVLKKPVRSLADFKGLALRSTGTLQKLFTKIGAAASYLPGAEIYPALASGVKDGAHWGAAQGANKMGFYEVCKYHLKPSVSFAVDVWLFNQKAIDKLPQDLQKILYSTVEEHFFTRSIEYIYQETVTLAKVQKERGVQVVTIPAEDMNKITRIAVELWDEEAKKGPEAVKALDLLKNYLKSLGRM